MGGGVDDRRRSVTLVHRTVIDTLEHFVVESDKLQRNETEYNRKSIHHNTQTHTRKTDQQGSQTTEYNTN